MATQASASESPEKNQNPEDVLPQQLSLKYLSEITNGFSKQLKISGEFATFYKGSIKDGRVITVMKLAEIVIPGKNGEGNSVIPARVQYARETTRYPKLRQIPHENILKLLGCCSEAQEMLESEGKSMEQKEKETDDKYVLYYEYALKSLRDYLSDDVDWPTRFKIIKGICQGLHFLHEEKGGPIVHTDLQPGNILLDASMVPKIANFSLAQHIDQGKNNINTGDVVGQKGYMAPEYVYSGEISPQCDIYSLGILMLEMATGQKTEPIDADKSARNFIASIRQTWTDEHIASKYSSLDPTDIQDVKTCIDIGLQCVDVAQKNRPSIVEIVNRFSRKRGI